MNPADHDLRSAFEALRQSERAGAPPFARLLREPRPRRNIFMLRFAAIAVLLIVIAGVSLHRLSRGEAPPADATALLHWRAPTDVLLKTPGNELLNSVPSLRYSLPGPISDKRTSS